MYTYVCVHIRNVVSEQKASNRPLQECNSFIAGRGDVKGNTLRMERYRCADLRSWPPLEASAAAVAAEEGEKRGAEAEKTCS